eukprot:365734-Chlamydomonas_euryale.AAC.8
MTKLQGAPQAVHVQPALDSNSACRPCTGGHDWVRWSAAHLHVHATGLIDYACSHRRGSADVNVELDGSLPFRSGTAVLAPAREERESSALSKTSPTTPRLTTFWQWKQPTGLTFLQHGFVVQLTHKRQEDPWLRRSSQRAVPNCRRSELRRAQH